MTNMTPDRLGQRNGTGDAKATFKDVFSGEVLTAYEENNVMDALHITRTIQSGKSASFPVTWKVSAGYHTPGQMILGSQTMNKNEMIISVDDLLFSDAFIANIDEAMSHVEYRQEYSRQIGAALAREKDKRCLQAAVLASRASSPVTGGFGGSKIVAANARTDGDVLAAAIASAAIAMDEKDVPMTDRSGIFKPAQTHLLATTPNVIHKDLGGDGNVANGYIGSYDNVKIVKSNNVPTSVISGVTGDNNTYSGTFTDTVGVVMSRRAIGTVKLMDLVVEMTGAEYAVTHQGTLIVGKYLQGHGILSPMDAVEIGVA